MIYNSSTFNSHIVRRVYNRAPHLFNGFLIVALILAAFGLSLLYDFVWDDKGLIVDNPYVKNISNVSELFSRSFWSIGRNVEDPTRSFYRPLISLTYLMDHAIWGLKPAGYHLSNLIGHTFTSLFAYGVAFVLFRSRVSALMTALLFAVHPSHVENVCWISGRTDVFCGAFYFLSLLAFLLSLKSSKHRLLLLFTMLLSYFAALLCKEVAITLPAVVLMIHLLLADKSTRNREIIWVYGLLIFVTMVYFLLRTHVLGEAIAPAIFGTLKERLLSIPKVFAIYLGSLFSLIPVDPHHDTAFVQRVGEPGFIAGVSVSLCYGTVWLYALWRRAWRVAFFLAWIPITLAPTFKLGSFGDVLHADRFLYLPSFGFAALFVLALTSSVITRIRSYSNLTGRVFNAMCVALVFSWTIASAAYSRVWRDNLTLFGYAATTSPNSAYIAFNLGVCLAQNGEHERAVVFYMRALKLDPAYKEACTNLGISFVRLGQYKSALDCFQRSRELGDSSNIIFYNMAEAYRHLGLLEKAITAYRLSLKAEATVVAHSRLGACLLEAGKLDAAEKHILAAIDLVLLSIERQEYDNALESLDGIVAMAPLGRLSNDLEVVINYNFSKCYLAVGNRPAAISYARRVLELAQKPASLHQEYATAPWLLELVESK